MFQSFLTKFTNSIKPSRVLIVAFTVLLLLPMFAHAQKREDLMMPELSADNLVVYENGSTVLRWKHLGDVTPVSCTGQGFDTGGKIASDSQGVSTGQLKKNGGNNNDGNYLYKLTCTDAGGKTESDTIVIAVKLTYPPAVSLKAFPFAVERSNSILKFPVDLKYQTENTSSCYGVNFTLKDSFKKGQQVEYPEKDTTYTLKCLGGPEGTKQAEYSAKVCMLPEVEIASEIDEIKYGDSFRLRTHFQNAHTCVSENYNANYNYNGYLIQGTYFDYYPYQVTDKNKYGEDVKWNLTPYLYPHKTTTYKVTCYNECGYNYATKTIVVTGEAPTGGTGGNFNNPNTGESSNSTNLTSNRPAQVPALFSLDNLLPVQELSIAIPSDQEVVNNSVYVTGTCVSPSQGNVLIKVANYSSTIATPCVDGVYSAVLALDKIPPLRTNLRLMVGQKFASNRTPQVVASSVVYGNQSNSALQTPTSSARPASFTGSNTLEIKSPINYQPVGKTITITGTCSNDPYTKVWNSVIGYYNNKFGVPCVDGVFEEVVQLNPVPVDGTLLNIQSLQFHKGANTLKYTSTAVYTAQKSESDSALGAGRPASVSSVVSPIPVFSAKQELSILTPETGETLSGQLITVTGTCIDNYPVLGKIANSGMHSTSCVNGLYTLVINPGLMKPGKALIMVGQKSSIKSIKSVSVQYSALAGTPASRGDIGGDITTRNPVAGRSFCGNDPKDIVIDGVFTADNYYNAFSANDSSGSYTFIENDLSVNAKGGYQVPETKQFLLKGDERVYAAVWDDGLIDEGNMIQLRGTVNGVQKYTFSSSDDWEYIVTNMSKPGKGGNVNMSEIMQTIAKTTSWQPVVERGPNGMAPWGMIPNYVNGAKWIAIAPRDKNLVTIVRTKLTGSDIIDCGDEVPGKLPEVTLTATPTSVPKGSGNYVLDWVSNNADSCVGSTLNANGLPYPTFTVNQIPNGSAQPGGISIQTLYTITCTNQYGQASDSALVNVYINNPTQSISLKATKKIIYEGETSDLMWTSEGFEYCQSANFDYTQGSGNKEEGTLTVSPVNTTNYSYTCSNKYGAPLIAHATIEVRKKPKVTLEAVKTVKLYDLVWKTENAVKCSVKLGAPDFEIEANEQQAGTDDIEPTQLNHIYTIECENSFGDRAEATVDVPPPWKF